MNIISGKKLNKLLVRDAVFDAHLRFSKKYDAIRKVVLSLFEDSVYGHDKIQTILNLLLANEHKSSFFLDDGIAIPHLHIEEEIANSTRVGWYRVEKSSLSADDNINEVGIVFCVIGNSKPLNDQLLGRATSLMKHVNFKREFVKSDNEGALRSLVEVSLKSNLGVLEDKVKTISEDTIVKDVIIRNKLGLHARAIGMMVSLLRLFDSEMIISKDGIRGNARDILSSMMLAAACGSRVTLEAAGPDAEMAITALSELINNKFYEED